MVFHFRGISSIGLGRPPQRAGATFDRHSTRRKRASLFRLLVLSLITGPTLIASVYYGLIASKRYVSEAHFIVRGMSSNRATGIAMLFRSFGISRAVDDANAVQNYMLSRDLARTLETRLPLRKMFSRPEADLFARFPHFWRGDSFERLYDYYLERVSVVQAPSKGITTLRVVAFRPRDAKQIADETLKLAEKLVNSMNARAQADALRSAQAELSLAENRVKNAQRDLTQFRNRELLIDPTKNSSSILETITSLSAELTRAMAQIQEMRTSTSSSPALQSMYARVDALEQRISIERRKLAGNENALSDKIASYDQLTLAYELAQKSLSAAYASLEIARQEARRQQIYIENVVAPNMPDEAEEPQRIRSVATVFVCSFMLAAVIWILGAGAKEHAS